MPKVGERQENAMRGVGRRNKNNLSFSVSRSCSKFLQRHIFWRKLSSDEREKFSTDQHFQWTSLDDFASKGLDTETAELVNKLKNSSNHGSEFIKCIP